jgi:hypothetical protein
MPGPLIHMSNARHTARQLKDAGYRPLAAVGINGDIDPNWAGTDMVQLGKYMSDHPNFTAIGAVGPDLFFFLPDFRNIGPIPTSTVLADVLGFLEGLYATLDPYLSKWEHYLGPISEDTGEEMSRLTGGLSETVGDITGELSSILITVLENFAVNQVDFLGIFSLGLDHGWDDKAYFWSDMLHYRRTAEFGRALWRQADKQKDDQLRAYALGYLTHVGADTTGHPYVNAVSGGPYRTHWTRHHLTENHIDALWYIADPDSFAPNKVPGYAQLTESALYYDIAFDDTPDNAAVQRPSYPGGNTLRDNWTRRRLLDIDSTLPDGIAQLLLDAINEIYYTGGVPHPHILNPDGKPDKDMLKNMYDLFFRLQKLMTVDGFNHEPPDPPDVFPNLDFPTPTDPAGDAAPGSSDGGSFWDDLLDFLLSVIAILAYIAEVAAYLATLPWAILADLVTYPLRLGLYYSLELPLFHLLKNFRAVMVMMGYFLPMADEISPSMTRIGVTAKMNFDQVMAEMGDVFGAMIDPTDEPGVGPSFRDPIYPHPLNDKDYRNPWNYPGPDLIPELPGTTASPYAWGAGPSVLFADHDPDPTIRHGLESAKDPCTANTVGLTVTPEKSLGSCVGFSKYTLWLASRNLTQGKEKPVTVSMTNWNLDSDRGYGYHCWDFNRQTDAKALLDPNNNPYQPPCVWPPQADAPAVYLPNVEQKIHWVGPGLNDPGCAVPDCADKAKAPPPIK